MSNTQAFTGDPAYLKVRDATAVAADQLAGGGTPMVLDRQTDAEQWHQVLGDKVPAINLGASGTTLDPLAGGE